MGRAIVREPVAFLMDEPLSNLDAKLRVQMRAEIARIQRDLGTTTIYVTHDQSEAMTLGHRVAVMRNGVLQQVAPPQQLYDRPANLFVAGFIGSPAMNLTEGELAGENGNVFVTFGPNRLRVAGETVTARPALKRYLGKRVGLGIRPEDMEDAAVASTSAADQRLTVTVDIKEDMGSEAYLHFATDAPPLEAEELKEVAGEESLAAAEELTHHHGSPFIARVGRSSTASDGQRVELAVDTRRLHFFDLDTGEGIYGDDAVDRPAPEAAAPAPV
jgi:multiple sugar transport system ATP-binding protein